MLNQAQAQAYYFHYYQQLLMDQYLQTQAKIEADEDVLVKLETQVKEEALWDASTGSEVSPQETTWYSDVKQELQDLVKTEISAKQEDFGSDNNQKTDSYHSRLRERKTPPHVKMVPLLQDMVSFFVTRFGFAGPGEIRLQRQKYFQNQILVRIFDILSQKYADSGKTREDMARFAVRKAMTYLRNELRTQRKISAKDASVAMSRHYFAGYKEEDLIEIDSAIKDEELLSMLPYKKNSRDKTPNMAYISKIFLSKLFCADYEDYLKKFEEINAEDNQKKIEKFMDILVECVKQGQLDELEVFTRLPWTDEWVRNTKRVAIEIFENNRIQETAQTPAECQVDKKKKVKKQ